MQIPAPRTRRTPFAAGEKTMYKLGVVGGERNKIYRVGRGLAPAVNSHRTPICHPERSEGSPIAQNKNIRNEILRLTAQNDN